MRPYRADADGMLLFVRLTPRAASDAVAGTETTADGRMHIAAKVRAVPEKGAANAAVERLMADWLGVPKASVALASGATSRLKTLRIAGDTARLIETIEARLSAPVHRPAKRR